VDETKFQIGTGGQKGEKRGKNLLLNGWEKVLFKKKNPEQVN